MSAVPRTLLPLLLAAMLEGCASPGGSSALPAGEVATLLAAHHWRLDEATERRGRAIDALMARPGQPLQLDFGDGRLAVSNTCNRMSAPWRIEADALQLGPLASTMMACTDPALASLDREVATRLRGRLQLALDAGPRPRLVLTTAGGDRLAFSGHPTAATRHGGAPERIFLEVAAQARPCHHPLMPEMQCLQVRQVHYDAHGLEAGPRGEWQLLYDPIEGYVHRPGVRTVLRIDHYQRREPVPADASRHAYVLDMVVESEAVDP